jgi:hypothetical protein
MPCGPVQPVGPVGPWMPCGPVGPVGPCGPVSPVGPCGPVGPCAPLTIAKNKGKLFAKFDAPVPPDAVIVTGTVQ